MNSNLTKMVHVGALSYGRLWRPLAVEDRHPC